MQLQRYGQLCEAQGFKFTPMVVEAHSGAWSPTARKAFEFFTQKAASMASSLVSPEILPLRFAQRMSIALRRENARAILRRTAEAPDAVIGSDWDNWLD